MKERTGGFVDEAEGESVGVRVEGCVVGGREVGSRVGLRVEGAIVGARVVGTSVGLLDVGGEEIGAEVGMVSSICIVVVNSFKGTRDGSISVSSEVDEKILSESCK